MSELHDRIIAFVAENPGCRIQAIFGKGRGDQRWPEAEDYFKRLYNLDKKLFLKVFDNSDLRWSVQVLMSKFFKSIVVV